jgi:LmbE family N-acetylglucosaminyl deacetylase
MGLASSGGGSRTLLMGGGVLLGAAVLAAGLLVPPAARAAEMPAGPDSPPATSWITTDEADKQAGRSGSAAQSRAGDESGPSGSAVLARTGEQTCLRSLNVVAHEDDDLLFINPPVSDDIAAGRCVVTIFLTAGDAGRGPSYWRGREKGAMAAYAAMAGTGDDWVTDQLTVEGHRIARASLPGTGIALLFLRLPDGHGNEQRPGESLQALWRQQVGGIGALDDDNTYYTREDLIGTLTAAMDDVQPDQIRTLDYAGRYGDGDHADHHTAGYLTVTAQRDYRAAHRVTGYLGYPVEQTPVNLSDAVRDEKLAYFLAYAPFDTKVCQAAEACLSNFYAPRFSHSVAVASAEVGRASVPAIQRIRS